MKIGRMVLLVVDFICIMLMAWWFASWVDVILHNSYPNPVYQAWNFFTLYF